MMDELSELLSVLKDKGLHKSYDKIIKNLNELCNSLDTVKDEVNDILLNMVADGKYSELGTVSHIPNLSNVVKEGIVDMLEGKSVSELNSDTDCDDKDISVSNKDVNNVKINQVQEENSKIEEDIKEYAGIITSVKGLQIGASVVHKTFGKGKIIDIEQKENSSNSILRVEFDDKIRGFSCTPEILEKYFGIIENVGENGIETKVNDSEIGYNLYTNLEFFTSKKPYKIKIFDKVYICCKWYLAAILLFKELYTKDKKIFLDEMEKMVCFSKNSSSLRRPIFIIDGIYFEGNKSSKDIVSVMAKMSDRYLDVYKKDVRRNVEIFLR